MSNPGLVLAPPGVPPAAGWDSNPTWRGAALALVGTALILGLLVHRVEGRHLAVALASVEPGPLGLGIGIGLLNRFLFQGLRLARILAFTGHVVPLRAALIAGWAALPLQLGTPGKLGAVVPALWFERHRAVPALEALGAMLLPRLHSAILHLTAAALGVAFLPGGLLGVPRGPIGGALGLALALGWVACGSLLWGRRRVEQGLGWLPRRLADWSARLLAAVVRVPASGHARLFGGSAAITAVEYLAIWWLFRAAGVHPTFFHFLAGVGVSILAGTLPVSLAGLGIREATLMVLFAGIAPEPALLSAGLLWSAGLHVLPALLGLFFVPAVLRGLIPGRRGGGAVRSP